MFFCSTKGPLGSTLHRGNRAELACHVRHLFPDTCDTPNHLEYVLTYHAETMLAINADKMIIPPHEDGQARRLKLVDAAVSLHLLSEVYMMIIRMNYVCAACTHNYYWRAWSSVVDVCVICMGVHRCWSPVKLRKKVRFSGRHPGAATAAGPLRPLWLYIYIHVCMRVRVHAADHVGMRQTSRTFRWTIIPLDAIVRGRPCVWPALLRACQHVLSERGPAVPQPFAALQAARSSLVQSRKTSHLCAARVHRSRMYVMHIILGQHLRLPAG